MKLISLAKYVSVDIGILIEEILLLRHSNDAIENLKKFNVELDEYTCVQPIYSHLHPNLGKYDFYHPNKKSINCVIVIVHNKVESIQIVDGVDKEGTNYSITSPEYQKFDHFKNRPEVAARRYNMRRISSKSVGLKIFGWENSRTRTSVQRYDGGFFDDIYINENEIDSSKNDELEIYEKFEQQVKLATEISQTERLKIIDLEKGTIPRKVSITSYVFERNPYVAAEALYLAKGICQKCHKKAPFFRRSNQSPYLEVHHLKPLSQGGSDTLDNAIAVCPNCHREFHYG